MAREREMTNERTTAKEKTKEMEVARGGGEGTIADASQHNRSLPFNIFRRDGTLLLVVRTFNRASENHARSELALCALRYYMVPPCYEVLDFLV